MANEIIYEGNLNIVPGGDPLYIPVKQYDGSYTRKMLFTMYDGSTVWDIPSTITKVVVEGSKPDNTGFSYECTRSGSVVTVPLMLQMTTVYGRIPIQVTFYDDDDNRVASASAWLMVAKSAFQQSDLASSSDFQSLISYVDKSAYYADLAYNNAKTWAVGGTGIREGEDTDNSSYYRMLSKSYAEGGSGVRSGEDTDNSEYYARMSRLYKGSPLTAETVADMTDTERVYVYVGSESGYTNGNWYFYNGSAWVSGGVYNSQAVQTDTSLTIADVAADAEAVGLKLDEKTRVYNTAVEMIADDKLKNGMSAKTLGFYEINDGGGAFYRIQDSAPSTHYELTDNNRYATLVHGKIANIRQYGAKGDGVTDDTAAFAEAINSGFPVYIPDGQFLIDFATYQNANLNVSGNGKNSVIVQSSSSKNNALFRILPFNKVRNLAIKANQNTSSTPLFLFGTYANEFKEYHYHVITDLFIEGNNYLDVFYFANLEAGAVGGIIRNCYIQFCNNGIWFNCTGTSTMSWTNNQYVEDVVIYSPYTCGFRINFGNSSNCEISHCTFYGITVILRDKTGTVIGFRLEPSGYTLINPTTFNDNTNSSANMVSVNFGTTLPGWALNKATIISGFFEGLIQGQQNAHLYDVVEPKFIVFSNRTTIGTAAMLTGEFAAPDINEHGHFISNAYFKGGTTHYKSNTTEITGFDAYGPYLQLRPTTYGTRSVYAIAFSQTLSADIGYSGKFTVYIDFDCNNSNWQNYVSLSYTNGGTVPGTTFKYKNGGRYIYGLWTTLSNDATSTNNINIAINPTAPSGFYLRIRKFAAILGYINPINEIVSTFDYKPVVTLAEIKAAVSE